MLEIRALNSDDLPQAADLFTQGYKSLRRSVPVMPEGMENPDNVIPRLEWILANGGGLAAVQDGRLAGYLSWLVDADFRGTGKSGAYCPEWGHAVGSESPEKIYRRLYHKATGLWAEAGYQVYALTYLANNSFLDTFVFHNGFGMIVMDAVRPIAFKAERADPGVSVRKCSPKDAALVAALDEEHCEHYTLPPTLMTPREVESEQTVRAFMQGQHNAYWLAEVEGQPAGFIRFEYGATGASAVVRSDLAIGITGAFIRPQHRGRAAAQAILEAALQAYAQSGLTACWVDFESINPDAYGFWRKYFTVVCHSVVRYPEQFLV